MTPSVEGQQRVLEDALLQAGFEAESIGLVECHGTGTVVGDRVELTALGSVLAGARPRIGSVKANLGHTLAASGAVGLMRAALSLFRGELPPQAGWESWHPDLLELSHRLQLDTAPGRWEAGGRRALVNSFGFGGTNVSLALEHSAQASARPLPEGPWVFRLSAGSRELLAEYRQSLAARLDDSVEACAYTVTARRSPGKWSALFVARDRGEAQRALRGERKILEAPTEELPHLLGEEEDPLFKRAAEAAGDPAALEELFPASARRLATLPPTPVQREEYWFTR